MLEPVGNALKAGDIKCTHSWVYKQNNPYATTNRRICTVCGRVEKMKNVTETFEKVYKQFYPQEVDNG